MIICLGLFRRRNIIPLSLAYFSSKPTSSEVLTAYLTQCNEPPWTSYFVKYRSVKNDQFGMSNFNWKVGKSNYQILRTGCYPYIKYHCSRRPAENLEASDKFMRVIKVINLAETCIVLYSHLQGNIKKLNWTVFLLDYNMKLFKVQINKFLKGHTLAATLVLQMFMGSGNHLTSGIPCLLYGLAATQLIRHTEVVHTSKGPVTIYFLLPEDKGSLY